MSKTDREYDAVITRCEEIFLAKMKDYGLAWRILRLPSLTDQIFIKAGRIRSIQEKKEAKINEPIDLEFVAIVNYATIALIQMELGVVDQLDDTDTARAHQLYQHHLTEAKTLMQRKNHDYGEIFREMRISSITDMILQKVLRLKQIEDNQGKTIISEGREANYLDMINYAVFALILIID